MTRNALLIIDGHQLAMPNLLVKNYSEFDFLRSYRLLDGARILNAGSASVRYGTNCVNIDIQQKPNVDIVCDLHALPASLGLFHAVVCNAVLQYCSEPQRVADEFARLLKPGGLLFVDAPWVQPSCPDTPDRYRFSSDALRSIFSRSLEIVEIGPSIRPGSAFAMLGVEIAANLTTNRWANFLSRQVVQVLLWPFRHVQSAAPERTAGAFYLIARKPG